MSISPRNLYNSLKSIKEIVILSWYHYYITGLLHPISKNIFVFKGIDKISSLSCQKVADSITSSKMGNTVAKQASVLLRSIPEYIRRYPSAYCTI